LGIVLDALFLKFSNFVKNLISPLFAFELKPCSWYKKKDFIDLTLLMSVMNCYAEGLSQTLREYKHAPTSETLLDYLKTIKADDILEIAKTQIDLCIETLKTKGITLDKVAVAFDWHDQPYYGSHQTEGVIGTKPKNGTAYAFSFLTVSVLTQHKRIVLAVIPLKSRKNLPITVLQLLNHVKQRIKSLLYVAFDNGFQDSQLLQALINQQTPFVIPLRDTVKLQKRWRWKRYAKRFIYFTQGMEIDVVEAVDTKANRYFLGTNMSGRPKTILKLYKKRWGIETSYRMIRQFQSKTTSNSYAVRVFYFVLAVLLYNVWVLLNARVKNHVKVVRLKLSCFWSLPSGIINLEKRPG